MCVVFLQPLYNVTVAVGGQPVTLICVARAENLYWSVNDTWYTHQNAGLLRTQGFSFSPPIHYNDTIVGGNITVRVFLQYNNTNVKCLASIADANASVSAATILIAGMNPYHSYCVLYCAHGQKTISLDWLLGYNKKHLSIIPHHVTLMVRRTLRLFYPSGL